MISVYLSNNNIHILAGETKGGRLAVSHVYELQLEEGCLINGVITNEELLAAKLGSFWKAKRLPKKNITLVIHSSEIIHKAITIPDVNDKKTLALLNHEFADTERLENPVYDYMTLSVNKAEKTKTLFAVMTDRGFIDSYVNFFASLDMRIGCIISAPAAVVKLLCAMPEMKNETAAVQLIDGNMLFSILWIGGQYRYSQRTRLFMADDADAAVNELAQNMNSMRQFFSLENKTEMLSKAYLGGISEETLSICARVYDEMGIEAALLPESASVHMPSGFRSHHYVYTAGALFEAADDINLYRRYLKDPKKAEKQKAILKLVLPVIICLVIAAAAVAGFKIRNMFLNKELDEINAFLEDEDNIAMAGKAQQLNILNTALRNEIKALESARDAVNSYPLLNSRIRTTILSCREGLSDLEISSYYAETGVLKLTATTDLAENANVFIQRLKDTGLFVQVEYTGYQYTESNQTYNINVVCYLSENAGK